MDLQTNISHPFFAFVTLLAAVAAVTYVVYFFRKKGNVYSSGQRFLLAAVKFLYAFFIGFLILSPVIGMIQKIVEKPVLVVGVDNSVSMAADSSNVEFVRSYMSDLKSGLSDKYSIETILFGEKPEDSDSSGFSDLQSDYAEFFRDAGKRYFNMNVGAFLLVGDGIYNRGPNPLQVLSDIEAPVFTLGVGDTVPKTDQAILDVIHNPNVFMGNSFPVEVEVGFTRFPYESTQISIYLDDRLVKSEQITVPQPDYFYRNTFFVDAEEEGLQNVSVVVSPLSREDNTENNRYSFVIEVHDNKKNILMLSHGPHPDIGAITETLEKQANYEVSTEYIAHFDKDLSTYDLVVLNQLPARSNQNKAVFDSIVNSNKPILIIVGQKTSIAALNNMNLDFSMQPGVQNQEALAYFNTSFSPFSLPGNIKTVENIYPPLVTRYTQYEIGGEYSILAHQKIKGVEMNYPLIMTGDVKSRKTAVIFGEGIWRWRLREFQYLDSQDAFNHIIVNLFNYLSLDEKQEQFKIQYDRIVSEVDQIVINAQVFNEIFEPVTGAEVSLVLKDSTGNELDYIFDSDNSGYALNLGYLSSGEYSFEASVILGDKQFVKTGQFSVQDINIENQNLLANFNVLNSIANRTGGRFFTRSESGELSRVLLNSSKIQPRTYEQKNIYELIDWKLYLLIVLGLLSLEWFLRKFWGGY
ncbi:MAG TPA: hypothetical protein VJ909_04275 [Prolixibacteraceae bacterium]|nr:hypothetical protein [Prolixibacteraceae bacterium]